MTDYSAALRLPQWALRARQLRAPAWPGGTSGAASEEGAAVVGLRDYSPGDDPRQIDWCSCARRDELLTRIVQVDVGRQAWLVVDASASMAGAKFEFARGLAAGLVYAAAAANFAVRAVVIGAGRPRELPVLHGLSHAADFVRRLMQSDTAGAGPDWRETGSALARRGGRRGAVAVVGDFFGPGDPGRWLDHWLTLGFRPALWQIYDPREADCAVRGDVELRDAETGSARTAVIGQRTAARYRQAFARFLQSLAAAASRRRVPLRQVRCDARLDDLIPSLFGLPTSAR